MDTITQIKKTIEEQQSFVLEAGAGSGKTYTLIQTLHFLLSEKGEELKRKNQKIVCVTYTNVAKNEIIERLENNALVTVSTIHEFLWSCIKPYTQQLIIELDKLNAKKREEEVNKKGKGNPDKYKPNLKDRITQVSYDDSGYRNFEIGQLHHDDVIVLSHQMFETYHLLTRIIAQKYPYLLIDEYQDTKEETVEAIISFILEKNKGLFLVGFYGDSYQKIYDEGIGSLQKYVDTTQLKLITKKENYRSSKKVIELLNRIRTNITQEVPLNKIRIEGSIKFIDGKCPCKKENEKDREYKKRINPYKIEVYQTVIKKLEAQKWNFSQEGKDKIILLVNSKVAEQAQFGRLYSIYSKRYGQSVKDKLIKREDKIAAYLMGFLDKSSSKENNSGIEHLARFWEKKNYNEVIHFLKTYGNFEPITKHHDKTKLIEEMNSLMKLRKEKTVGDVFNFCINRKIKRVSKKLSYYISEAQKTDEDIEKIEDNAKKKKIIKNKSFFLQLMSLPYQEFINAFIHIQEESPFSTQHGTKGEEYRNVLMVIDDQSWNQYNFLKFFNKTDDKSNRLQRTRNLFYVSCSRAKENLVVLALSEMDESAINQIKKWFGKNHIF